MKDIDNTIFKGKTMEYLELKKEYRRIGSAYSFDVLSGYVDFFSSVLNSIQDKRNTEYRINRLRLMVYRTLLKEKRHDS